MANLWKFKGQAKKPLVTQGQLEEMLALGHKGIPRFDRGAAEHDRVADDYGTDLMEGRPPCRLKCLGRDRAIPPPQLFARVLDLI